MLVSTSSEEAPFHSATPFHSAALGAWLGSALLPSLLTSNPIYLLISLVLIAVTHQRLARHSPSAAAWRGFARLAAMFALFTLAFNVLLGGAGETTLFELPAWRINNEHGARLFQLGGPVTLEGIVYGLTMAFTLLAVIYALATFNALADHSQLLRGLPRWLDQAATVASIAFTFMPQLVAAQREIREALALRGHRIRGFRDLMPLLLTLLGEALERAMTLAESMEARGFSGPPLPERERHLPRLWIALGLFLVVVGAMLHDLRSQAISGVFLAVLGVGLIVLAVRRIARRGRRTRYRRELWRTRDTWLVVSSLGSVLLLIILYAQDVGLFFFRAFPRLDWPPVDPRVLLLMTLVLTPLVLVPRRRKSATISPDSRA